MKILRSCSALDLNIFAIQFFLLPIDEIGVLSDILISHKIVMGVLHEMYKWLTRNVSKKSHHRDTQY